MGSSPTLRICLAAAALFLGAFFSYGGWPAAAPDRNDSLPAFPMKLGPWTASQVQIQSPAIDSLHADGYLDREYTRDGSTDSVELFVAFYARQRWDKSIHSPRNCVPESGWDPVRSETILLYPAGTPPIEATEYIVRKGPDRRLILYWYQSRGRVVAGEYEARFRLLQDAFTKGRTDGSLVRLATTAWDGDAAARLRASAFAQTVFPLVLHYIPD